MHTFRQITRLLSITVIAWRYGSRFVESKGFRLVIGYLSGVESKRSGRKPFPTCRMRLDDRTSGPAVGFVE